MVRMSNAPNLRTTVDYSPFLISDVSVASDGLPLSIQKLMSLFPAGSEVKPAALISSRQRKRGQSEIPPRRKRTNLQDRVA